MLLNVDPLAAMFLPDLDETGPKTACEGNCASEVHHVYYYAISGETMIAYLQQQYGCKSMV